MLRSDSESGPHRSGRFHYVREHLNTRFLKFVCTIFLGFLLLVSILAFILWLSIRPHRPWIYIRDFWVPGLTHPDGFDNANVNFHLSARNPNHMIGVYYDAMRVTLTYRYRTLGGAKLLAPFYVPPDNTTVLHGVFSGSMMGVNKRRWMEFQADRRRGEVTFRLKITSTIRFRVFQRQTSRRKMHSICLVGVDRNGLILDRYKDRRCLSYFI
ncbi:NDR1/HIN1-like protein 12 [Diospyros lotus]|uniref:NDR1/HIN1-like protein 12 n=1 Tax=Diospyros lotus TaxID=55363 RepID=UPI00225072B3|nr:NDR1/HIN1-like protein 12 [Diospyros lotus]